MAKKVKRIRKIKVTDKASLDPVAEFFRKKRENCKHERGYITCTVGPSICSECGKPWN